VTGSIRPPYERLRIRARDADVSVTPRKLQLGVLGRRHSPQIALVALTGRPELCRR
jgi:hypothetical protein